MKKSLIAVTVILLALLTLTGCKEATDEILFSASEDILGYWITLDDVNVGGGVIQAGAAFNIYESDVGHMVDANYYAYPDDSDPGAGAWTGSITPDPTTSAYCSIEVEEISGDFTPDIGDVLSMAYNMSGPNTAVIYVDGNAYRIEKQPG